MLTKEELDEIRKRYEAARAWKVMPAILKHAMDFLQLIAVSADDIRPLLDALEEMHRKEINAEAAWKLEHIRVNNAEYENKSLRAQIDWLCERINTGMITNSGYNGNGRYSRNCPNTDTEYCNGIIHDKSTDECKMCWRDAATPAEQAVKNG